MPCDRFFDRRFFTAAGAARAASKASRSKSGWPRKKAILEEKLAEEENVTASPAKCVSEGIEEIANACNE